MTNPPYDGDEREAGTGTPDPDRNLTQPVQPFDRPAPPGLQPHGRPPGYGPPPQQYGQPGYGPGYGQGYWQPGYGPPASGPRPYGPSGPAQAGYGPGGPAPQYGPPGQVYAPPSTGPTARRRAGLIAVGATIALLLILGVVVLVLTLQSTVLDPAAVERDVAAQFEQREGVPIDLDCAEEMEVDEGDSYRCTGVTADEEEVTLQITIADEETAAYTWTEP